MITFKLSGSFDKTNKFFDGCKNLNEKYLKIYRYYAKEGLEALQKMTPVDTGLTASKWTYKIGKRGITYENSSMNNGVHVVILLQYGHATSNGGYVQAIDFINPALRPIFDKISQECWKEVSSL